MACSWGTAGGCSRPVSSPVARIAIPKIMGRTLGCLGDLTHDQGDPTLAAKHFREGLTVLQEAGDLVGIVEILAAVAAVANDGGQPERATRLLGAAMTQCEVHGLEELRLQVTVDRVEVIARGSSGETACRVAWKAGRALTLEEAVAEALALADELVVAPDA